MLLFEEKLRKEGFVRIAGVDEAGRGPLAGPLYAAACVLPNESFFDGLDDSKKLTEPRRRSLFHKLVEHPNVSYGIGRVSALEVDQLNVYQATLEAMKRAVEALHPPPEALLVDAMPLQFGKLPVESIIRGDSLSLSIAAASILAKESRDQEMRELDQEYPEYGFAKHKGYGTALHKKALAKHGPCPAHRRSFAPVREAQNPVAFPTREW